MKLPRRQFLHLAATATAFPTFSRLARAQAYPDRPVRVVVGFAPGGPTDVIARIVALKLSERLGQQFYVENIPGANGNTATGRVAHAKPDGSTLLAVATGFVINPSVYAKVPYDPVKDFQPVTLIATSPNVVTVNPTVPARTVAELVALIRATPGKYSFAQTGTAQARISPGSCSAFISILISPTCRSGARPPPSDRLSWVTHQLRSPGCSPP